MNITKNLDENKTEESLFQKFSSKFSINKVRITVIFAILTIFMIIALSLNTFVSWNRLSVMNKSVGELMNTNIKILNESEQLKSDASSILQTATYIINKERENILENDKSFTDNNSVYQEEFASIEEKKESLNSHYKTLKSYEPKMTTEELTEMKDMKQNIDKFITAVGSLSKDMQSGKIAAEIQSGLSTPYSLMVASLDLISQVNKTAITTKSKTINDLFNNTSFIIWFTDISISLIGLLLCLFLYKTIKNSISDIKNKLKKISDGDLTFEINYTKNSNNEFDMILNSIASLKNNVLNALININESFAKVLTQSNSISSASQSVSTITQNISSAINDIATGATQQSTDLIKIVNNLDEFQKTLDINKDDISNINADSIKVSEKIELNNTELTNLINTIKQIYDAFKNLNNQITLLTQDINDISNITETINTVASQTNLLALNASIEAARAGEHGRGFAVVADEVRKLAEQSKVSSLNISNIVRKINNETESTIRTTDTAQSSLENGVKIVTNTVSTLSEVFDDVKNIISKFESVYANIEDIVKKSDEISSGVQNISAVAEENTAYSEEICASTEELTATSQEIKESSTNLMTMGHNVEDMINKFKLK